nr:NlpC/P60 family protein [uncultured Mediterraneibacter sp.]
MKKKKVQMLAAIVVSSILLTGTMPVSAYELQENEESTTETVISDEMPTADEEESGEGAESVIADTEKSEDEEILEETRSTDIMQPEAVTNLKAQIVNWNQVQLTWDESDAEGYLIYRKAGTEENFSYCYMVSGNSFKDTKAERGVYNFYRVYPYNTDDSGKRIVGASTEYVYAKPGVGPEAVTDLKASLQYSDYVQLSWNASKEAEGYLVYRKTAYEDTFTYRYMVSGTTFMDNTALQGEYNYYRIYPYYTDENGKRCVGQSKEYVYAKPVGVPQVTDLELEVDQWDGKVNLYWSTQYNDNYNTDIDGFIIYRKVGNDGSFKYHDIIKAEDGWVSRYYTDEKASMSEYNFYKVYAYSLDANGKKRIGPCTSYVYGKASIPAVSNLYSYEQIGQVRVQWEKNNNAKADGYCIYRKQGDGKFEYLASTMGTEYVDTKASKSKTNFYRVYPYRTINNKKVIGMSNTYVYGKAKNYSKGQAIADYGWQFIGTPYVWGGNDLRKGVDCSGFTSQVHAHFGISLPRTAAAQAESGVNVGRDLKNARPGDIICFCYDLSEKACHASIYVGNGRIIHSTSAYRSDGTEINGIQIGDADYMIIKSIRRYY